MDTELDTLKKINLVNYATSQGYEIDQKKTSRAAVCMRSGDDKIFIGTDSKSGHSVFYSVKDDKDNGTIVDFVQRRQGLNLGKVRQELRPWAGIGTKKPPEVKRHKKPVPTTPDQRSQGYRLMMQCFAVEERQLYLELRRAIDTETLQHFSGQVYTDIRGNAVFPHFLDRQLSGLELKNQAFTGFSAGGQKGLWLGGNTRNPDKLIVCESAIDALSHYQLHPEAAADALYISTGGQMSPEAREYLETALDHYDAAEIVAAFDNDDAGREYAKWLEEEAKERDRALKREIPGEEDWNAELKERSKPKMEIMSTYEPRPAPIVSYNPADPAAGIRAMTEYQKSEGDRLDAHQAMAHSADQGAAGNADQAAPPQEDEPKEESYPAPAPPGPGM